MKPKIYLFVNSGKGTDWQVGTALSEDGEFLAGHVSSNEEWAKHDMGLTSDWNHDQYTERYPEGFKLEWVDDAKTHPGVQAAYAKHVTAGELGTPWQQAKRMIAALAGVDIAIEVGDVEKTPASG